MLVDIQTTRGEVGHPHPFANVYDRKVILMDESFGIDRRRRRRRRES